MTVQAFFQQFLADSVAIFTIMNPISAGVVMLSLFHEDVTREQVRATATKASRALLIAMFVTFAIGSALFEFFNLTADALRVFGGIILLFMGINMIQGHEKRVNHNKTDHEAAQEREDISVVPLAIPIILGPGLATTLITQSVTAEKWTDYLSAVLAIVGCVTASYFILRNMIGIRQRLGLNGLKVFNRIMGLIVGSLAAQMIIRGAHSLWISA